MCILTIRPWKVFAWKLVLFFWVGTLTGILLALIRLIIVTRWNRVFGLVAIFFFLVVYSNVLAKVFLLVQRRVIPLTKTL